MTEEEEEGVRMHMRRNPDHELTIDGDDRWVCLTCERLNVELDAQEG